MTRFVLWVILWSALYLWSTSITGLRLYLRHRLRRLGRSDAVAASCVVLSTIMYGVAMATGARSFGAANSTDSTQGSSPAMDPDSTPATNFVGVKGAFVFTETSNVLVPLSKCCITLLLLEVETARHWRMTLWVVQSLILLTAFVNTTISFFGCYTTGPETSWGVLREVIKIASNQLDQKSCVPRKQLILVNGSLNGLYELTIFICAISLVFRIKTRMMQRIGLGLTFSLGIFTIAATAFNTTKSYWIYEFVARHKSLRESYFFAAGLWTALEAYTGMIVASILPIRATLLAFCDKCVRRFGLAKDDPDAFDEMRAGSGMMSMTKITVVQEVEQLDLDLHAILRQDHVSKSAHQTKDSADAT